MADLSNKDREAARLYHEVTKHSYTSVRSNPHRLDWDNRPFQYKIYPAAGSLAMPRELELPSAATAAAIAGRAGTAGGADRTADLEEITRLLFCTGGLTRSRTVNGEEYHFRAAASAGALYPIEIYLAAGDVDGVEPGLYHFSPADLKLRGLRRGDWRGYLAEAAGCDDLRQSRAILIFSAIFWRSAWKYRARAWRYCFWDAGTMLANLLAVASADGISAEIITLFADAPVERLLDVDGDREGVVCLAALGRVPDAPAAPFGATPPPSIGLDTLPLSANEVVYDDLVKMHRASRLDSPGAAAELRGARLPPADAGGAAPVMLEPLRDDETSELGATILRRGSTREFAREAIDGTELATILATATAPIPGDFLPLVEPFLIVNAVDGLDAGVYRFHRAAGNLELLRAGEFRGEAGYLCLEQPLGSDCSALICYMMRLDDVLEAFGNRGYRMAHLEAGVLGGRAYLAAYSIGRGATGLTFYDDDASKFFSPDDPAWSPLLMLAVGAPKRRVNRDSDDG
ncbi:SagB/ThcOx family dehydrogenase [bacterium]|nr:SagB/ThcOx family dehydrogenase [bacterium]